MLRCYPFYSGMGRLVQRVRVGQASGDQWATLKTGDVLLVPNDDFVGRAILFSGDFDPKISWVCSRVLRPGDVALDVGANLGAVTAVMSKCVGPKGQVHSFEPNPVMHRRLQASLERNHWSNVIIHPVALGAIKGRATLRIPAGNAGSASLALSETAAVDSVEVDLMTLSGVPHLSSVDRIRLVKLDVEGWEPEVLRGAVDLFSRVGLPDVVVFEWGFEARQLRGRDTVDLLESLGYGFIAIERSFLRVRLSRVSGPNICQSTRSDFIAVPLDSRFDVICAALGMM